MQISSVKEVWDSLAESVLWVSSVRGCGMLAVLE